MTGFHRAPRHDRHCRGDRDGSAHAAGAVTRGNITRRSTSRACTGTSSTSFGFSYFQRCTCWERIRFKVYRKARDVRQNRLDEHLQSAVLVILFVADGVDCGRFVLCPLPADRPTSSPGLSIAALKASLVVLIFYARDTQALGSPGCVIVACHRLVY